MTAEDINKRVRAGKIYVISGGGYADSYIVTAIGADFLECEYLVKKGDFGCRIGFRSISAILEY